MQSVVYKTAMIMRCLCFGEVERGLGGEGKVWLGLGASSGVLILQVDLLN